MSLNTTKWYGIQKLLGSCGPFQRQDFEPQADLLKLIRENVSVLVIGAGGLGCELLKDLVMMGFRNIDVIDADTIELSNLNRQFLFRNKDIGRSKADVAAEFIRKRVSDCNVIPHHARIQEFDAAFYRRFHVVVCGLDSIVARRWINGMLSSLVEYDDKGQLDLHTVIPLIDGGTEGFKGNIRVVLFGKTPCVECTLDLYPPQVTYPLCTLAHTPRLPEHCIEFVRLLQWPKELPFGPTVDILDPDNPAHLAWVHHQARDRARVYGISPLPTYRLTQGVLKHIVPAVASTNAVIAAACVTEVFKVVTFLYDHLDNYMNFNDTDGVYSYSFALERKEDCLVCGNRAKTVSFSPLKTLSELIRYLKDSGEYQLKNPALTTVVDGKDKTLFINLAHLMKAMQTNLSSTLTDLGLKHGQLINVTDETCPGHLRIRLDFADSK